MKVANVLAQKGGKVHTIKSGTSVAKAAAMLVERRVGALLVVDDDGKTVGVLSERDIVAGLAAKGGDLTDVGVETLMTADVIKCSPDDTMVKLMGIMTERRVRHIPVYDGDRLEGIVSIGDAVKSRIEEIETEAAALREYISM
jgi:CBS domain-containing protein